MNDVEHEDLTLEGVAKPAVTRKFGEDLDLQATVPLRAELELSLAVLSPTPVPRARPRFHIRVVSDGHSVQVLERTLRLPEHNRWQPVKVNLSAWAGKKVTLRLGTGAGTDARVAWADRIRIAWGDPVLDSRPLLPTAQKPSVVVILVDTLRYDYLGIHGFEGDISPHLDWLGLESLRFDRAIAPAPWTKPSVASLFTGLYPDTHGVLDEGGHIEPNATDTLSPQAETLAEVFQAHGYDTAAFVGNSWLAADYGYAQGFDTYVVGSRDDALVARARNWLQARDDGRPYFLYIHLMGVHGPYRAPERDYALLKDSPSLGHAHRIVATDPSRPEYLDATPFDDDDERDQIRAWRGKYAASVRKMDRTIGELIDELRRSGELDRGYLVFTSDHGEEFLEHASWVHGYELCGHQLHVPLWIREPGAVSAGQHVEAVVSLVDVLPTVLSLLSLPIPEAAQGMNRYPSGDFRTDPVRTESAATAVATGVLGRPSLYALRTQRYHIIWDRTSGDVSLYDLEEDPQEARNVASLDPETVSRLERELRGQLDVIASAGTLEQEEKPIPEDLRERLRALGYVH